VQQQPGFPGQQQPLMQQGQGQPGMYGPSPTRTGMPGVSMHVRSEYCKFLFDMCFPVNLANPLQTLPGAMGLMHGPGGPGYAPMAEVNIRIMRVEVNLTCCATDRSNCFLLRR
jgi:hypothetical protein